MKTALKWSLVPLTIMNITIKVKIITKLYGLIKMIPWFISNLVLDQWVKCSFNMTLIYLKVIAMG